MKCEGSRGGGYESFDLNDDHAATAAQAVPHASKPVLSSDSHIIRSLTAKTHHNKKLHTVQRHPCIFPGLLNRAPASAGVKAGKSPLQVTLCDPIWHVIIRRGEVISITTGLLTYL